MGFYMGFFIYGQLFQGAPYGLLYCGLKGLNRVVVGVNCFVSTIPCSRYPIQAYS